MTSVGRLGFERQKTVNRNTGLRWCRHWKVEGRSFRRGSIQPLLPGPRVSSRLGLPGGIRLIPCSPLRRSRPLGQAQSERFLPNMTYTALGLLAAGPGLRVARPRSSARPREREWSRRCPKSGGWAGVLRREGRWVSTGLGRHAHLRPRHHPPCSGGAVALGQCLSLVLTPP